MARLARLAWLWALALLPIVHAGCSLNGCRAGSFKCSGDLALTCAPEDGTEFYDWRIVSDCASQGQVCREGSASAECVYPDRPCSTAACTAGEAINCGTSGFVTRTETCEADATCELNGNRAACVYTQATCGPGVFSFCAADGVTLYWACDDAFGAATRRDVCSDSGAVCVTQTQTNATCAY